MLYNVKCLTLACSDRLHAFTSIGSGSANEVSSPHAGEGASPDFHDAVVVGSGTTLHDVVIGSQHAVAHDIGVSAVKKAKLTIQTTSVAQIDCVVSSSFADSQKVVPTAADLLSMAIEIKRSNPGCGVKKVLLEMLHKHPDWAITEHRVGKLLHENGLANVKKLSSVTANTESISQPLHRTESSVADIHFDILSLPQSHADSTEHWQCNPLPSHHNFGSSLQSADFVDLDKLFNPASLHIPNAADASVIGEGSANEG
jgi:hypothetical protein